MGDAFVDSVVSGEDTYIQQFSGQISDTDQ
jgi:hypothetical protein